jgi:hypothetical protein
VDRLTVKVEAIDNKSKVEVVRSSKDKVKDIDSKSKVEVVRPSKAEVEEVNRQEVDKRACGN